MAPASSSAVETYDVFLSFRGEDTRYNFTSHLYDALCRNNIKAFIDYKIDRGDEITPSLERVIEGAKISIIIFSKRYAESAFCLDELVRIMECKTCNAQIVLPIFYKVDPLEITYQQTFARHQTNTKGKNRGETIEQVERWKSAFHKALDLVGWHLVKNSDEAKIIGKITKTVSQKLNNSLPKGEKLMCTSMVGQTTEDNFKKIWKCLMNNEISKVGVYGMGGVGKTTIATLVNDQLLASINSFSHVCWVTVSKDLSIRNMQNNIAKMVDLDLSKEDDERKRAAKLRKKLKTEKFVLILDDVWEAFEIEDLGIPYLVDGQKLLLTSRSRRVCEIMECQPIEVKPLSNQEALDLFMKECKYQINDSIEWRDVMRAIVKECDGLPLAIVVIARRLRGVKEIRNWRNTLRELQKPSEGENLEMEKKVFQVLKFSYDCLPNEKYRQCFLYCSLFPEDHEFKRVDLIDYWFGERLIEEIDSRQAELDKGNAVLDELIHSSLLESTDELISLSMIEDDDVQLIKMHDMIRDMARLNVKVGLQFLGPLESVQVLNETMLESFPNLTPYYCSKLKTLVLENMKYIKELSCCFFSNMQNLCVLHIKRMYSVKSIPDSISSLGNLKVLKINDCSYLKCIPSLFGLEKLQYLKISSNWSLKEIPKGIESLVSLRVLDLSLNASLSGSIAISDVENLFHLQTLNLRSSRVEVALEALISLEKLEILKIDFFNLQKLNCYVKSRHWQKLLDYQINYGKYNYRNWKKGMCLESIKNVEEWKEESVIFLPDDIQNLRLIDWESSMFYILKSITFGDLQTISISVYKSKYLFTVYLVQQLLHNVQQLHFKCCYGLEEIIATKEEWLNQNNYTNYPTIVLHNLKILSLFHLSELRSIYRGRMVCPSLESIQIEECDNVERLPFCREKEANKQNSTIELRGIFNNPVSRRWWDSLQWDDPNTKSLYRPKFEYGPELVEDGIMVCSCFESLGNVVLNFFFLFIVITNL